MLLTVITSSYNSEKTIERTFNSILQQAVRPLEYIVIDGGSTDQTTLIIKKFEPLFLKEGIIFKWLSESDTGIYNAWNKGLRIANGDYIAFLGSDDIYEFNALEKYKLRIEKSQADFVCAKTRMVKADKLIRTFGEAFNWYSFQREMKILHAGSFINSSYFEKFGQFDESFQIVGDYELLMRKGAKLDVDFIDEFLVEMDAGGVSSALVTKSLR